MQFFGKLPILFSDFISLYIKFENDTLSEILGLKVEMPETALCDLQKRPVQAQFHQNRRNQVADFMFYLEKAGIIAQSRGKTEGIRQLGKVENTYIVKDEIEYGCRKIHAGKSGIRRLIN